MAWVIIALSLLTIPAGFTLSEEYPLVFLLISCVWLVSPVLFTRHKGLFNLCVAQSLFFITLYARSIAASAVAPFDPSNFLSYHLEQGLGFLVLFPLARHFYSLKVLRITRRGLIRACLFGLAIGLPFGTIDYLSGEKVVPMPAMNPLTSLLWIASLSLLVGLLEETLFRGVMYRPARAMVGPRGASLFQGILFSLVHYPNPLSTLAAALLFGVIMVYLVERTGNLFGPIVAHFSNNVVWMLLATQGIAC